MDKIPFHDISRVFTAQVYNLQDKYNQVFLSGKALGGKYVKELEEECCKCTGRKYAKAVSSGTDALSLSLLSLDLPPKSRVAVTPFTFPASYTCIYRNGFIPVFVDIKDDFQMDTTKIPEDIDAVIAVNMFGGMCDKPNVKCPVIEDAAQSFPQGTLGTELMCVSFDPTKIVPNLGTGGMVLSDNKELIDRVTWYSYKNWGTNSQMSEIDAITVKHMLWLNSYLRDARWRVSRAYDEGLEDVVTVPEYKNTGNACHKYVIRCKDRDRLKKYLEEQGIGTKVHYRVDMKTCPNATRISKEVLSLPMYPTLTSDEVRRVIDCVRKFYL